MIKPVVQLKGNHVGDPRLLFGRRSRGQLANREGSVCGGQSQLPKREGSVSHGHGLAASQSTAQLYMGTQSTVLTEPNDAKRKGLVCRLDENERPNKLCVWSTVAEQYVAESRQSDNQEAGRDAVYRRYSTDGRPCMRQQSYDAERHQANIKYQTQPAGEGSYDERRVEPASGVEDASSFYKRLGLDILTPSSTSGLSQQTGLNRENPVQHTCRSASQTSNPAQRSDNGVLQWIQSHQRDNQTNSARTSYTSQHAGSESVVTSLSQNVPTGRPVGGYQSTHRHGHDSNHAQHSNYEHWKQSNHANGHQSTHAQGNVSTHAHGHQPRQSHGHQSYLHGHQSTHSSENQARRAQTKTEFVNDGALYWSRRDPLHIQDQSQPRFDRPVRTQPQVKPIDKYAPPDYLTIMYHPTPTLEDLGLTSYLDSPPSSPRSLSPARDSEQSVTAATSESEQTDKTAAASCKQTDAIETTSFKQTVKKAAGSRITDTLLPWKLIRITIPDQDVKPAVQLEGSRVGDPRLLFGRRSSGQLTKREDSVCDTRHGLAASQPSAHQSLESQSSALTIPNDAKRKRPEPNIADRPKKKLCVWSMVAEQYVTESRQSDNQEARRDAVYRRYSSDGRPCMRQQSNMRSQTQSVRIESYDGMLARQKARQITNKQNLKPSVQSPKHTNCAGSTLFTDSDNKTSGPAVSLDLFGGMSPFSCWNRTAPEDLRFS